MARLALLHTETEKVHPVVSIATIGREGPELRFPDDGKMSRQHCAVAVLGTDLSIRDLYSTNSTWLNGQALDPEKSYTLRVGDVFAAGLQAFRVIDLDAAKAGVAAPFPSPATTKVPTRLDRNLIAVFIATALVVAFVILGSRTQVPDATTEQKLKLYTLLVLGSALGALGSLLPQAALNRLFLKSWARALAPAALWPCLLQVLAFGVFLKFPHSNACAPAMLGLFVLAQWIYFTRIFEHPRTWSRAKQVLWVGTSLVVWVVQNSGVIFLFAAGMSLGTRLLLLLLNVEH